MSSRPDVRSEVDPRGAAVRALLACGLLSSGLYAAMLVVVPLGWAGYSSASRTVSELSAIDAPTRVLWVTLGAFFTALYVAFGWGVRRAAGGRRALRAAGGAIMACGLVGIFWPPMHQREVLAAGGGTLTDTLHLVWTAANGLLTLLAMGLVAAASGKGFRRYSLATIAILVGAGLATAQDGARIDANLPTPWVGAWERLNIVAWLVWVAALAVMLLRRASGRRAGGVRSRPAPASAGARSRARARPRCRPRAPA